MLARTTGVSTLSQARPAAAFARPATAVAWTLIVALLVVPLTYGNFLGNVAILAALAALFLVRDGAALREVLAMRPIWLMVAAFALLGISTIAVYGGTSNADLALNFTPFLLTIPAAVAFRRAEISDPLLKLSTSALLGVGIGFCIAVFQLVALGNVRPGGWELSPIHFGDLAVILGFLSLGALMVEGPRWRLIAWAGPLLGIGTAVLSGTRGALLVAVPLVPLALCWLWAAGRLKLRTLLMVLVAIVVAVGGLAAAAPMLHLTRAFDAVAIVGELLGGGQVGDPTASIRLDQYQGALHAIADAPLLGHGWRDQIAAVFPYLSDASQQAYYQKHWGYVHNELLSFSVGMGLLGSLAWLLLAAFPPALLFCSDRATRTPARSYMTLAAWLGITVSGLSDVLFDTELTKSFYCFIPLAIVLLGTGKANERRASVAAGVLVEAKAGSPA